MIFQLVRKVGIRGKIAVLNPRNEMRTWRFPSGIVTGLALAVAASAAQGDLPLTAPVPGGVAIVCVGRAPGPAPQVLFDGHRALVPPVPHTSPATAPLPL